ncbi:hypothetical protein WDZ17_03350 [Pseudokineococcus basanitobsidens]|uniref:Uncharacterized protein n=1 Tax=Pseudokineococcus basanitobsidens TaxID=1926649 RepID=A0ABU8RGW6_9ACTN
MTTPDDSTRRPGDPEPFGDASRRDPAVDPTTDDPRVTDVDAVEGDDVLVVEEPSTRGGSAGPGLALAGLVMGLVGLWTAAAESAVRECTPDPVGAEAVGADGFLTALVLAVLAIVLSAVGAAMSRSERWGTAVGVAGLVVGVVVVVVWLLSVWLLAADPVDIANVTSQEATLPLQGYGCA